MILSDILAGNARRVPRDIAWLFNGRSWTWEEANARANRLADSLRRRGLKFQDRLVIVADNSNHYLELLFALAKIGAIAVPLPPRSVVRDIAQVAGETEPAALVLSSGVVRRLGPLTELPQCIRTVVGWGDGHGLPEDCDDLVEAGGADEAEPDFNDEAIRTIKFTSGTTGASKGCIGTHRTLFFAILSQLASAPQIEPRSANLITLSLATGLGLNHMACYAYRNAASVFLERFDAGSALDLIAKEKVRQACAVPTIIGALTEEACLRPRDCSSLEVITYSGSSASVPLIRRAMQILQCDFYQMYGSTESGGTVISLSTEDHRTFLENAEGMRDAWGRWVLPCGQEAPAAHVRLVDVDMQDVPDGEVGEILVRNGSIFEGYWRQPEQTQKVLNNRWLLTGDMARRDQNGYYYIVDRRRDMIVSGGYNVYTIEVESALQEHSAVAESAVFGCFNPRWGESVVACVRLREGCEVSPAELIDHCRVNLAGYKVPKHLSIVEDFPRTLAGKIRKLELRNQFSGNGDNKPAK